MPRQQCSVFGESHTVGTLSDKLERESSGLLEMCQEKIALGGIAQVNTLANQLENNKSVDRLEVMLR